MKCRKYRLRSVASTHRWVAYTRGRIGFVEEKHATWFKSQEEAIKVMGISKYTKLELVISEQPPKPPCPHLYKPAKRKIRV
jgi:hypothetical protein